MITKKIVEMMGGHISVSSELGAGTTATFNVLLEATQDSPSLSSSSDVLSRRAFSQIERPVLLAEDNRLNQVVLSLSFVI